MSAPNQSTKQNNSIQSSAPERAIGEVVDGLPEVDDFKSFLHSRKEILQDYLAAALDPAKQSFKSSARLWEAMNYSSLNGGKRLRGVLCLTVYEVLSQKHGKDPDLNKVLPIASGIECIHAMSLVHDDLPCMDNDDLRRGKPTCHKAYDEPTALLAGDALLVEGLYLCLKADLPSETLRKISSMLLEAVGARGMTGGQMIDLQNTNRDQVTLQELENMHKLKTGAFLKASVLAGAYAAHASEQELRACEVYADCIGLAFQIVDDLLDLEADSQTLGKTAGKDLAQNKATYPKLLGLAESKQKAQDLVENALASLKIVGIESIVLEQIAQFIVARKH